MRHLSLYLLSFLFVVAGLFHFVTPAYYLKVMPPYLPYPELLNWISGVAEIGLALLLLFPASRALGAWGLIALLIAVFPANIYMYQARATVFADYPAWTLLARLPVQGLVIWWVYQYV